MNSSKHFNSDVQSFSEWISECTHRLFGWQRIAMQPVAITTETRRSAPEKGGYINHELRARSRVTDLAHD